MPRLRPVPRKTWEKFLKKQGCIRKRQKASHVIWHKPGLKRPIVYQADKEVSPHIIKNNLQTLGIPIKDFFDSI